MQLLTTTFRISISLVCLAISVLFAARLMGLVPDVTGPMLRARQSLCETIAIDCSLAAERGDLKMIGDSLAAIVARNRELHSAALVSANNEILVKAPRDSAVDDARGTDILVETVKVPIAANDVHWATIELNFRPLVGAGGQSILSDPFLHFVSFVAAAMCLTYSFYLRRILQHLDPSKVVPDRVRMTLDTLAEGLFVIDKEERIVLANQALADTLGTPPSELQGRVATVLPWQKDEDDLGKREFPWTRSIRERSCQTGDVLRVEVDGGDPKTFKVSSAPIFDEHGNCQGALTSLDDVTALEERNAQLTDMLAKLQESRDRIRQQNQELEILATRDPLTSALNRRSFFEFFEKHWNSSQRYNHALGCVMVDIDHFKSINDTHGHATGDRVLQKVSGVLLSIARESDLVCRYGGEEFCVLLPHTSVDEAAQAAERYRNAIEALALEVLSVTASLGVSGIELEAETPQQLLEQADKSLYVAKRKGRNRVVRWDEVSDDEPIEVEIDARAPSREETPTSEAIPFQSVTALISALAYRDAYTAEHSRRVADLCVAVAHRLMSLGEAYVLENAALLHDIGKIGVPDSILLKPGPLTQEEWKIMSTHDRIGVEIIRSTFACDELTEIVQAHHAPYAGDPRHPELPAGKQIPLGARILTIADAYDAMVSDRVYRKGRGQAEAFAELRRCAGRQFDPELVERFIEVVTARDANRTEGCSIVSKKTALCIGMQIERIAHALDNRDIQVLDALVGRLKSAATQFGVSGIADAAEKLEECIRDERDWVDVLTLTVELLELCRDTQRSYINVDAESCKSSGPSEDEPLASGPREENVEACDSIR